MILSTILLCALVLALIKPVPVAVRYGLRLALGAALLILVLFEVGLPAASLAVAGFLLGFLRGQSVLDRITRGVCASAGAVLISLIFKHPAIELLPEISLLSSLLPQALYAFSSGALLQAGLGEDLADWRARLPIVLQMGSASWTLAAVVATA